MRYETIKSVLAVAQALVADLPSHLQAAAFDKVLEVLFQEVDEDG